VDDLNSFLFVLVGTTFLRPVARCRAGISRRRARSAAPGHERRRSPSGDYPLPGVSAEQHETYRFRVCASPLQGRAPMERMKERRSTGRTPTSSSSTHAPIRRGAQDPGEDVVPALICSSLQRGCTGGWERFLARPTGRRRGPPVWRAKTTLRPTNRRPLSLTTTSCLQRSCRRV
jgi:hypothetical protein